MELHRVAGRGEAASRIDVARSAGLSPLTGRDQEVGLLKDRWEHAKEAVAQLVHLTGEAGIGKSRLVLVLKEFVADDEAGRAASIVEWRCSPHYQDSGLYPAIECLERILRLRPDDPPGPGSRSSSATSRSSGSTTPRPGPVGLAALDPRRGPLPAPPLSPQRQKEKTLEALVDWLAAQAERRPVLFIVEDLHWVDPSTLEFLGLLVEQRPADRIMTRDHGPARVRRPLADPERPRSRWRSTGSPAARSPTWSAARSASRTWPADGRRAARRRTDGVPLFIEEFARMLEEDGHLRESEGERSR